MEKNERIRVLAFSAGITAAIFLIVCGFVLGRYFTKEFDFVDRCLDNGGSWNSKNLSCEYSVEYYLCVENHLEWDGVKRVCKGLTDEQIHLIERVKNLSDSASK